MVKNVIFDLGGVIVEFNPVKVVNSLFSKEDADFILGNLFFSEEWSEIDRGTLTPAEAFEKYRKDLSEETYEKILAVIENWNDYMPPFEDTYELVKRIKAAGVKIYLLSNVPPYIHKMIETVPALKLFDGFVASCDVKLLKPERRIYEHLLEKFNLKAEECFFIDDMSVNAEGARAVGMKAHHFVNHDVEALENALRQYGVSI